MLAMYVPRDMWCGHHDVKLGWEVEPELPLYGLASHIT
jgi:hypothetical protein